jgi:hypothetical protein
MANERSVIINQFKTDMVDSIKSSRGYDSDLSEVKLGIVSFDYFAQRPAIGYWMFMDTKDDEYLDDDRHRMLNFIIYGYADTDGLDDFNPIYKLADDIEKFLMSTDWTYTEDSLLGDIVVTVGGIDNQRCMFDLVMQVQYVQELT